MNENSQQVEILVLDFGSQYTQLIARRLREFGIYTEIVPYFEKLDSIKFKNPKGIILSGGPASVYEKDAYKPDSSIFSLNIPVLGICYGMQYIAHHFGGKVAKAQQQEFGKAVLNIKNNNTDSIKFDFNPCDTAQKQEIFTTWEKHFVDSHFFMPKKIKTLIATQIHKEISNYANFVSITAESSLIGFGLFENNGDFKLYRIDKNTPYQVMLKEFLAYLQNKLNVEKFFTQYDTHDKESFNAYINLGFAKGEKHPPLMALSIESSALKTTQNSLFSGVSQESIVWMSHADKVEQIPQGFIEIASSGNTKNCAIADSKRQIFALQFHPEVVHSECGGQILQNFAVKICKASTSWNMKNFAQSEITKLRERIGNDAKVLCAVSGGVDSSVVAALLYRAIGENLIPVFVDTGLLREGEKEAVEAMFKQNLKVPLISIDASGEFLGLLSGITEPEKKRKIIGETFIKVFEQEAKKHNTHGEIKYLAQGTLYPDVIESVSVKGPSKTIKSHHNVGGLPEWMKFELIEPLRELFKDEVRALGKELGMPDSMLMRHPFPGPGLAIRILGEVNKADLDLLRRADSIFIEELHKWGLYNSVWQAFCVLLNVKSVGVMGDNRTYDNTICVRAVEALDGMTASFSHLPHSFLESVSNRIINEVQGINRVVYDITSKPPGTIEWE